MSRVPDDLELALGSGGEMGAIVAGYDWESHPLGPMREWPGWMRTSVSVALLSRFPIVLWFGREFYVVYNDGYRTMLAEKHPDVFARPGAEVWPEIWETIGPMLHGVLDTGTATWSDDQLLLLQRSGYVEEAYFTFTYSPIVAERGSVGGIFCAVHETTDRVIGERRLRTLRELADELNEATAVTEVVAGAVGVLARNPHDLPVAGVYLPEGEDEALLAAGSGEDSPALLPQRVSLAAPGLGRTLLSAAEQGPRLVGEAVSGGGQAIVAAVEGQGMHGCAGWFVGGVSPRRKLDRQYRSFYELIASQLSTALARARAQELERRHAEELAELDHAKTLFFSNISHEFRTPLTLLLGPIEQTLTDSDRPLAEAHRERLAMARRNAMRLLRLVNTLLDFSRIEAGRIDAFFEEVDLGRLTADLASVFRSAVEQAGLTLDLRIDPLSGPVFVDVSMWEKIVLNLLSNAFKFTLEGEIRVRIREQEGHAVLDVADTGVGIPDEEIPLVFERFHRASEARGRSHEGSGIGLSLVRELVEAHGGEISATSGPGGGATFTVMVPLGSDHLPPELVRAGPHGAGLGEQFVEEAMRWLPLEGAAEPGSADEPAKPHILVVDDNADMRAYVAGLLRRDYRVTIAADGAEALERITRETPDLVLADVMMPHVDGLELVRLIRSRSGFEELPVILLSARAGPEAAVDGLDIGADDYLVKPFTAENLHGRIRTRLTAARERRQRLLLSGLTTRLAGAASAADVTGAVHAFVEEELGADNTTLALLEPDGETVRLWHAAEYGGSVNERYAEVRLAAVGPTFEAIREGDAIVLESREQMVDRYPAVASDFADADIAAELVTPLLGPTGAPFGSLTSCWRRARSFTSGEAELFDRAAAAICPALERVRAAELEHRLVDELQERLLDIDLAVPRAAVAVRYRPAEPRLSLGGDWYDVVTLRDGSIGLSVGDVVGKGLPAATVMAQVRSALGASAITAAAPGEALSLLDAFARRLPDAAGATVVYAVLGPAGRLLWCCAGHPPPLVCDGGRPRFLPTTHRGPLGSAVPPDDDVPRESILAPTSLLLLYSDGLVERRGEHLDVGLERLALAVEEHLHLPVGDLCDAVLDALAPAEGYADDVALVAARVPGSTEARFVDVFLGAPDALAQARGRLRTWLDDRSLPHSVRDDVLLAVGEAAANAVEHATTRKRAKVISIEAALHRRKLLLAVADTGRWSRDATEGPPKGRGRGLALMKRLTDDVAIRRTNLGTTVTMRVDLDGRSGEEVQQPADLEHPAGNR